MFCVWVLELNRHVIQANELAFYHKLQPCAVFQAACQASDT